MDDLLTHLQQNLELIKRVTEDENPLEYWSARELMPMLGYHTWAKYMLAINRAIDACEASHQQISNHFLPAPAKSNGGRPREDYFLTRYACYLVAQNGDPRKPEIALAQTYFATQTRKQELHEQREYELKRLEARAKLRETENKIETTVYKRGIKLQIEFATFKNKHIQALYGGLSTSQLKQLRNIPKRRSLADFDSHVELKAKDFALAMTDFNIKDKDIYGTTALHNEVVKNSQETRRALLNRGIKPELINPEEDLKKIENRIKKEQQKIEDSLS